MTFITEDEIDKALDYLRDTAKPAAKARGARRYVEEYRKTIKAMMMKEYADLPLGAQEREAYCSDRYQQHLIAIRDAVEADAEFQFLREAAASKIGAWQTMSKNEREAGKI